jgi:hypothetical protein
MRSGGIEGSREIRETAGTEKPHLHVRAGCTSAAITLYSSGSDHLCVLKPIMKRFGNVSKAGVQALSVATRKPARFPVHRQIVQISAGTRRFSMWKKIVHAFVTMDGRKCVGEDEAGNKFWVIPAPGQQPNPRREIEYNAIDMVKQKKNLNKN